MVTNNSYTRIRCPSTKPHKKKIGNVLVTEECCNTLLGFIDNSKNGTELVVKCKDCKSIISVSVLDEIVYLKVHKPNTKIKVNDGKVVFNA